MTFNFKENWILKFLMSLFRFKVGEKSYTFNTRSLRTIADSGTSLISGPYYVISMINDGIGASSEGEVSLININLGYFYLEWAKLV